DVLESKLQVILDEFGVDKTSDVLDSAEANHLFDELFMESISNPATMDQELAKALKVIQGGARDKRSQDGLFSDGKSLNPSDYQKVIDHPLPYWVEQMVSQFLSFKSSQGADASFTRAENGSICVKWPDGANWED
ncbi:helicase, partial [Vibrio parahaemolyticus]|nr:helicase [Vibrio parahaemolyticus]